MYELTGFMDQDDRIYTSKVISMQHYHGNIIASNRGNGTQPNTDFKVFKNHLMKNHLVTFLLFFLSMVGTEKDEDSSSIASIFVQIVSEASYYLDYEFGFYII